MTKLLRTTLGDACAAGGGFVRTGPFGSQLHQSDYVDAPDAIPVVMPKDMSDGRIDRSSIARIDEGTANRLSVHLLAAGDVVLSRRGDVGRSAWVAEDDLPVLCGTGSMRIHPGSGGPLLGAFLRYFMRSRAAIDYLEGQAVGATMPNLNAGIVTGMPMLLPALLEQRVIAEVLVSLDDLIENNRQRVELLEQMAQAIYREWFVQLRFPGHEDATFVDSPLGPIPEGWRVVIASDLISAGGLEVGDGYRAKNVEMLPIGEGLPFLRVANVRDGYLDLTGCDQLPDEYASRVGGKVSRPGDSVICMKGTVGRSAFVGDEMPTMVYSPQVSYWRSLDHDQLPAEYLNLWIRSGNFLEQCAAVKGATDMADYVNLKDQRRMRIVVPDRGVVAMYRKRARDLLRSTEVLQMQSDRLSSLRDLLLPKLVTGQIDVSELDLDAPVEAVA